MLAAFPVDGRALCGRGVRTLLWGRSLIVLYTPLVITASRRHRDLAPVAAGLGWDHPSPGMVCTRVHPVQFETRGTVQVWHYFLLVCRHARLSFGVRAQRTISKLSRVFCANSSVTAVLPT